MGDVKPSMWHAAPRGRRLVADLAAEVLLGEQRPRLALMIGAGFDIAIRARPDWPTLVERLALNCGLPEGKCDALKAIAHTRPIEAAEALKVTVGSSTFWKAVRRFVSDAGPIPPTELGTAVNRLINRNVRLVVNFNYTSDLLDVLSGSAKEHSRSRFRMIERSHLPSWNLQQLLFPEGDAVHVIHIHGLVDPHVSGEPGMILDRTSYNEATLGTSHYQQFLARVFQDYTVITIGMSWNDAPLLAVVAQVQFDSPNLSKLHCALLPHADDELKDHWNERGMISSYGVRPLFYRIRTGSDGANHTEAASILLSISTPATVEALRSPPTDRDLEDIASTLDSWGDYESGPQSDWMALNWDVVRGALERRSQSEMSGLVWLALASIERHLRHFLWFYMPPEDRAKTRRELWSGIATAWTMLSPGERANLWNVEASSSGAHALSDALAVPGARAVFEYAIGVYELGFQLADAELAGEIRCWHEMLQRVCKEWPGSVIARRIQLAERLWVTTGKESISADLGLLRRNAFDCAWEGIEAKIALDQAQTMFQTLRTGPRTPALPRNWGYSTREEILALSEDAANISRVAGCFRREVGSVVLGSFVAPPRVAERNLLAVQERISQNSGRRQETSMVWWVIIGLLAVYCDERDGEDRDLDDAVLWLTRRLGKLQYLPERVRRGVKVNSIPHWRRYHKDAAKLCLGIIRDFGRASD